MTTGNEAVAGNGEQKPEAASFKALLRDLYFGSDRRATAFQLLLLAFDLVTVTFFLVTSFMPEASWVLAVDLAIAACLGLDLAGRLYLSSRRLHYLLRPWTILELVVLASLLLPALLANLGFLRLLRALRLARSYNVLRTLQQHVPYLRENFPVVRATMNLLCFVVIVSGVVFVEQRSLNPEINNYLDALYFTTATLTTTGFGDITLVGSHGRVLSILIMIFGISLFLNLVHAVFRPRKVSFRCPRCALLEHDRDAVYCKACGHALAIPNEGA